MSVSILVTYATRYGSTAEVAEAIASRLRAHGFEVDLQPMAQVQSLYRYQAVVFGAPLYIGRWPREAHHFLDHHRDELAQRPLMIFTLGPTEADTAKWTDVRAQLAAELATYVWLKPVAVELFGGVYDPAKLRFPDNLLAKLPASPLYHMPMSDARDWSAIRTWTDTLVEKLQLA